MFQLCMSFISALGNGIWHALYKEDHYYLEITRSAGLNGFMAFFTYFVLNNTMIPISLIVSLEIIKAL